MQLSRVSLAALCAAAALSVATGASAQDFNLIGFNFTTSGSATPDPQNWNRISAPDGTVSNVMNDTGASTNVSITWGGGPSGGFVYLSTSTLAADAVPQHGYDLSGMTGYGFRSDGEFFITLSGLEANMPYEYWFVAYRGGSTIDNIVNVSDGDVIDATTFNQFITSTANNGRFVINTEISSDTQVWDNLSFTTMSSSNGEITFNWTGDTQTTVIGALAVRLIPAPGAAIVFALAPLAMGRRRR